MWTGLLIESNIYQADLCLSFGTQPLTVSIGEHKSQLQQISWAGKESAFNVIIANQISVLHNAIT